MLRSIWFDTAFSGLAAALVLTIASGHGSLALIASAAFTALVATALHLHPWA
jgi:hypothetical protein